MARLVYRFPPVYVRGAEWTIDKPINRSRRMWDQQVVTSGSYRKRRVAAMQTISIANYGGGYVEALKELLEGGENYVRLFSYRVNYETPDNDDHRQSWPLNWRTNGDPLAGRTSGQPLVWFTGAVGSLNGETIIGEILPSADGFGAIFVTGLPPNTLVVTPGEWVAFYQNNSFTEGTFERRRALRPATSNSEGACIVWTVTPFTGDVGVRRYTNLGVRDSGVFMVDDLPRAMRTPGADWPYDWTFTEVFEDETPGGFIERNPWGDGNAQGD